MARPTKQTVDYFPHSCKHGKTMFILEQKYGNDGYAFWFKLLELLGSSEGHYLKLENPADWEYLTATTKLTGETCEEILDLLAKLEAIDQEAWKKKIVWSDRFVDNVKEVYRKRKIDMPVKPDCLRRVKQGFFRKKHVGGGVSTAINTQSKVKESKVEEIKEKESKKESNTAKKFKPPTTNEIALYCQERKNRVSAEKFHDFYQAKGWMVGKNKMKDWQAAVRTWEIKDNENRPVDRRVIES